MRKRSPTVGDLSSVGSLKVSPSKGFLLGGKKNTAVGAIMEPALYSHGEDAAGRRAGTAKEPFWVDPLF